MIKISFFDSDLRSVKTYLFQILPSVSFFFDRRIFSDGEWRLILKLCTAALVIISETAWTDFMMEHFCILNFRFNLIRTNEKWIRAIDTCFHLCLDSITNFVSSDRYPLYRLSSHFILHCTHITKAPFEILYLETISIKQKCILHTKPFFSLKTE